MTVKECYEAIGADFEGVYGRMMKKESLVKKFARKFLDDKSYAGLCENLAAGNIEEAFRAAHTLKGVAQNLGFTGLYVPASEVTDILREGHTEGTQELMEKIRAEYEKTAAAIAEIED